MNKLETDIKNWDLITRTILIFSILILIFSFFSPRIFKSPSSNIKLDFTTTGPIGDTIGGLMSPFIALVGVLLTFLAFYLQIKAPASASVPLVNTKKFKSQLKCARAGRSR